MQRTHATGSIITYGYSRDKRADLKQWMLALATTQDGDVPLFLHALDGNSADVHSLSAAMHALHAEFAAESVPISKWHVQLRRRGGAGGWGHRSWAACRYGILVDVELRIGQGYDIHPLRAGRRLVLGGVEIAHERGLAGHSDADVLLHAMMDALLGAAGQGDIGLHFPPGDERWRDADSLDLLAASISLIQQQGWRVVNVDATVIAERPRIAPHAPLMRERIAARLGVSIDAVGIKATTNERLGSLGREEGIAALAVALLTRG